VVRQARDFSCGIASLATLLRAWGIDAVTEAGLLRDLLADSERVSARRLAQRGVSFAQLANLARRHGFSALGIDVATMDLQRLRHPVIVALDVGVGMHFSVLRGITASGAVLLADPSWGNRWLSAWEFRRYYEDDAGRGRLLLIHRPGAAAAPRIERRASVPRVSLQPTLR
jgi:predicted double-glycine peptidase